MKNSLLKGLLVFLMTIFTSFAFAQSVSGKVSDSSGPIPGASVSVKGASNSTQTDFDGNFTINAKSDAVLVFSFIGLKTKEVAVAGKTTLNVVMQQDQQELKEVIVIGYGSVKKKDATGAVDQLSSKSFDNISSTSPAELLRGKVSGVQVTSASGEPGAAASIRIRGNSSIRSGNGPLIVVDGVPLDGGDVSAGGSDLGLGSSSARNPLNFVNQNDIESMTILKDASSTAIYGSRGANGVIVITTKKSKSKEPSLSYANSVTFSSLSSNLKMMNASEFVANGGANNGASSYNWEDAILQSGLSISHDLSYSKSTENSSTRLSFGVNNTEGIVKTTGLDKYTFAFNNSNDFFNGALKIDTKVNYAGLKDKAQMITNNAGYQGNLIGSALYWNPTNKIYNANGSYNIISNTYINPVQLLDGYKDYSDTNKLLGSIKSTLKINNNLNYQFLFGVETSTSSRKIQLASTINIENVAQATNSNGVTKYGQATIDNIQKFNRTFEHTLNYNKTFNDNFVFDALAGYSYYDYTANGSQMLGKGYDPAQTNLIDNIEGGLQNQFRASSWRNRVELQSFFGRVNATLYKKFLVTATLRTDGSTKLGANNKYGTFPSIGLGYKVFEGKEGLVNSVKLRANYGKTGNQEFAVNSAVARASYGNDNSLNPESNPNSDLKWETTLSSGVGVDFTLLNNRLSGTVEYFQRDTENLILPVPTESTQPSPASARYINVDGNLINKGFEVSLNYKLIDKADMTWDISGNVSFLNNEMKNFGDIFIQAGGLNGQGLTGAYSQIVANNQPIYSYYLYEFKGYDANGASIYTDVDGNNNDLGFATKKLVGKQGLPKMNLGFSTSFTYKNFDASTSFYGAFGHYLYNNTANAFFFKGAFLGGKNVPASSATSTQAQGDPNAPSTKYLEKGDFLRMGNITFGYTFSGQALEKLKIKSARFFVNGQNLLLFTKYSGFDPEVNTDKSLNGVPSAGIDYLSYPRSKAISLGLNVTF